MDEILHQLGELVLGSVPTMILFVLLVAAYGFLVQGPLERILAERRLRTSGAIEQANSAIAAAEAETAAYEEKLRGAKAAIFAARAEAREAAQTRIGAAREEMKASVDRGRTQMESISEELSSSILRAILPATPDATPEATR